MYDVIRTFNASYIILDLVFVLAFLLILLLRRKWIPLAAFFIGGLFVNFFVDWGIWYHTGIREIYLPASFLSNISLSIKTVLFMLWLSLSYGVEYAYVFLMFEKKSNKYFWTAIVFIGWILIGFLSQYLPLNNDNIQVIRHMSDLRYLRIILVIAGYSLLFIFKYDYKKIGYLFFVGFIIHFMMEFSLLINNIRPGSMWILIENSLVEFNMGIPFFYLLYDKVLKPKSISKSDM
jgi:hypothetical protein